MCLAGLGCSSLATITICAYLDNSMLEFATEKAAGRIAKAMGIKVAALRFEAGSAVSPGLP